MLDGQVYRHQGQIVLASGQILPAGYTGPLQLAHDDVEGYLSSIERPLAAPVPQTVIMSAASAQPSQGHTATFTGMSSYHNGNNQLSKNSPVACEA